MYRIYRKIPDSFQGGFGFLLKKWYISEEFLPISQLISWSLPDDEGGITCMFLTKLLHSCDHIQNQNFDRSLEQ